MSGDDELMRNWLLGQGSLTPLVGVGVTKDSPGHDAFDRLRVSDPETLFDATLYYDDGYLNYFTYASGSVTSYGLLTGQAAANLDAGLNSTVIRQSKKYVRYQPGKSQLVLATFVMGKTTQAVTRRVGYFDRDDGIFLEQVGEAASLVIRSSVSGYPVEDRVSQANWNIDIFDGSGTLKNPSEENLDLNKAQILVMDLEWLGVGKVSIGFVLDGVIRWAHRFDHANLISSVYMRTANLPLRWEIAGGAGVTGTHRLQQICGSVISEGGFSDEFGIPFAASNGPSVISVTTRRPILSIRPRQLFKGQTNRVRIVPEGVQLFAATQPIFWELVYGAALGGANFTGVFGDGESAVESDAKATGIVGGFVIDSGYVVAGGQGAGVRAGAGASSVLSKLPLTLDIAGDHPTGTTDVLTLMVTSLNTATNVSGALSWREER